MKLRLEWIVRKHALTAVKEQFTRLLQAGVYCRSFFRYSQPAQYRNRKFVWNTPEASALPGHVFRRLDFVLDNTGSGSIIRRQKTKQYTYLT